MHIWQFYEFDNFNQNGQISWKIQSKLTEGKVNDHNMSTATKEIG